ncbi:MAG: glycosyltransferase family 2 protein [Solobacterium sp.]|nr:glycosyltransferase family 2 protein [Solobacterium sp.]
MADTKSLISVIIPVYNVEEYIDICLETVVNQTFQNLEILLINDGSTDGSSARCHAWAEKDSRIRVIDKENEGVAASRNRGIELASGEYISFIDPDDWVDLQYFEKLYSAITENDADLAECDLWRYDNRTGKKIYRTCYGVMGVPYTLRQHMKYGPTATYKALSRRELWTRNHVRMPSCSFESPAVYALVLALCRKIINVREPLYWYRRFRENSLIETGYGNPDGSANLTLGTEAMRYLITEFKRCGLYEEYRDTLEGTVKYRLSDILATQFHRRRPEDYRIIRDNYYRLLEEEFPKSDNSKYITWGGYNLNRILVHMNLLHDPSCRFNFSSLISLLGTGMPQAACRHKNRYRQMMVQRDMRQTFCQTLREEKPVYIFLDLIDERFDILKTADAYITCSDAYEGIAEEDRPGGERISFFSQERTDLWKQAFDRFAAYAAENKARIIVFENYLSETVGDLQSRHDFEEISEIRHINYVLQEYYHYVRTRYPMITMISGAGMPEYFTDKNYEYGAVPSHLNEIVNRKLAEKAEEML